MVYWRSFLITCNTPAIVPVTVQMLRELTCPRMNPSRVFPPLFHEMTQVQLLDQDGVTTVYVSARNARAVPSVVTALRERGLDGVRVEGLRTEDVPNRTRMREAYSREAMDMFERLVTANRDNVVSFVGPSVKIDLFGNRQWGSGRRMASSRRRRVSSASLSPSPSVSASSTMSIVSNPGEGPVSNFYSPRYEPRDQVPETPRSSYEPTTPSYDPGSSEEEEGSAVPGWARALLPPIAPAEVAAAMAAAPVAAPAEVAVAPVAAPVEVAAAPVAAPANPFANDPQYVVDLRNFLNAHGADSPDFSAAIERFSLAQLRAIQSPLSQELLGVMEPAGEPFVRDFAAYLNTHRGDHTHAEFQTRLGAFVLAYLERLHPDRANYNFAIRMFFAFQSPDHSAAFREALIRIAGGVSLVDN